jgi:hypothetical protein
MARVVIHMEMKAKDSKGGLTEADPPEMIVGTAPHFNWKGVSTIMNFGIVALVVDTSLIIALSMPLPLILTTKASLAAGTSTEGVFLGAG